MSHHRDQLHGQIACVTFTEPPLLAAFECELTLDVPVFGDPGRATYDAFGFGRGSLQRVWLHPRVWAAYARLLSRGQRPDVDRHDKLQLGGDVVVDREGVVRWIYRSEGPDDRPRVATIADRLRAAAEAPR